MGRSDGPVIRPFIVFGTLLFSLVLLRIPLLFPGRIAFAAALLPFCAAIWSLLSRRPYWRPSASVVFALGYVLLALVTVVRGVRSDVLAPSSATQQVIQVCLVSLLGALAFLREPRAYERERNLRALCWAPVVFVAVNVGLFGIGYAPAEAGPRAAEHEASTLGLLGLSTSRTEFPMNSGLVFPLAAVSLAICIVFAVRNERRSLALGGAALSLFAILAIDSRGSLIFGVLAAAIVLLAPRARERGFGWIAISLPVFPLVMTAALTNFANMPVSSRFSRGGFTEDISTGTGRTVVWDAATSFLGQPSVDNIFGHGLLGQKVTGVSLDYAYLFRGDPDPLAHTVHNGLLQTTLDTGWVGGACLIALAVLVLARLSRRTRESHFYLALLAGALALLLSGIVEAVPTPVLVDSFAWWLLVVFAATREWDCHRIQQPLPNAASLPNALGRYQTAQGDR